MTAIVRITAMPRDGFRRAGIHHPAEAVDHPADRFDDAAFAALLTEPNLKVEVLDAMPQDPPESAEGGGSKPPPSDADGSDGKASRMDLIRGAIRGLDPANPDHFTKGGKPDANALSGFLGQPVTAAERDEAWADVLAERAAGEDGGGEHD